MPKIEDKCFLLHGTMQAFCLVSFFLKKIDCILPFLICINDVFPCTCLKFF